MTANFSSFRRCAVRSTCLEGGSSFEEACTVLLGCEWLCRFKPEAGVPGIQSLFRCSWATYFWFQRSCGVSFGPLGQRFSIAATF